jgi:hypothetical protein
VFKRPIITVFENLGSRNICGNFYFKRVMIQSCSRKGTNYQVRERIVPFGTDKNPIKLSEDWRVLHITSGKFTIKNRNFLE